MTPEERAQSLINARRACEWLKGYFKAFSEEPFEQEVTRLLKGFELLDAKEQAQIEAGKLGGPSGAPHGSKGGWKKGRPRGSTKEKK